MTIKLEEGKFYKRADGSVHGPAACDEQAFNNDYPWQVGTGAYTPMGQYYLDQPGHLDLIAEVTLDEIENGITQETEGVAASFDERATSDEMIAAMAAATEAKHDIKTTIADEAKRIVSGARRSAYGKPEQNFERIARFWDAYFKNTGRNIDVTAADVSPLMRLMKEARLCETPDHYDSHVDLVGYTLTGSEVNGVLPPA